MSYVLPEDWINNYGRLETDDPIVFVAEAKRRGYKPPYTYVPKRTAHARPKSKEFHPKIDDVGSWVKFREFTGQVWSKSAQRNHVWVADGAHFYEVHKRELAHYLPNSTFTEEEMSR